jgi:hypothetical protein
VRGERRMGRMRREGETMQEGGGGKERGKNNVPDFFLKYTRWREHRKIVHVKSWRNKNLSGPNPEK